MPLENAPSLDDFEEGLPAPTQKPEKRNARLAILLGVVVLLGGALLFILLARQGALARLAGRGAISGFAVDEQNAPIVVTAWVFGSDRIVTSDERGHFQITDVPAGEHDVIVAYGDIAVERTVTVVAGDEVQLGWVTVPTTLEIE